METALYSLLQAAGLAGASGHRAFIPALALGILHHISAAAAGPAAGRSEADAETVCQERVLATISVSDLAWYSSSRALIWATRGRTDLTLRSFDEPNTFFVSVPKPSI